MNAGLVKSCQKGTLSLSARFPPLILIVGGHKLAFAYVLRVYAPMYPEHGKFRSFSCSFCLNRPSAPVAGAKAPIPFAICCSICRSPPLQFRLLGQQRRNYHIPQPSSHHIQRPHHPNRTRGKAQSCSWVSLVDRSYSKLAWPLAGADHSGILMPSQILAYSASTRLWHCSGSAS